MKLGNLIVMAVIAATCVFGQAKGGASIKEGTWVWQKDASTNVGTADKLVSRADTIKGLGNGEWQTCRKEERASGKKYESCWKYKIDGKFYPVSNQVFDQYAIVATTPDATFMHVKNTKTSLDEYTMILYSADGKTRTAHTEGTGSSNNHIVAHYTYKKQ
jgi:hypothetical protein